MTGENANTKIVDGRYLLTESIGGGRMSSVYAAEDQSNKNKLVAVKLLNTQHPDDLKKELFKWDSAALEALNHPNIVRMTQAGWDEQLMSFFLVMEYVPHTLDDYFSGRTKADAPALDEYSVMVGLADALAHAHAEGFAHRDIKPSNILIDSQGDPQLTDFGISKLLSQLSVGETLAGFWSPGYASPEQQSSQFAGFPSDVYSLGSVFYQLLSKAVPPPDGADPELVEQSLTATPRPVKNVIKKNGCPRA